jgi:2-polyprenyl-3-methyl-5-hydroxy-6-metoxy-1,4-benzoquinol methylase
VTFTSKEWGRMVFVKIMTPVVDRGSGRVLGWTVVLNINSVNKRVEFFESLYGAIAEDTKRRFYAACYDGILSRDSLRRDLIAAHAANLGSRRVILDLGARTGELTFRMAREGRTVTSVEEDAHLLQRVRDKTLVFGSRVRLVKQSVSQLTGLPKGRYEGATMLYTVNRLTDPSVTLKSVYEALKVGGVLTLSAMIAPYSIETILNGIRQELSDRGRFLALKDQFNHVAELERQFASATPYRYPTREELLAWVQAAGFTVEKTILKGAGPDQPKATILLVLKK